jgi:transcriptional regulator with XRE-family HTH domain
MQRINQSHLRKLLRRHRQDKGWSIAQMSVKLGYKSPSSYQKIEDGSTSITLEKLDQLSGFLGISVNELLGIDTPSNSPESSNEIEQLRAELDNAQSILNLYKDRLQNIDPLSPAQETYFVDTFERVSKDLYTGVIEDAEFSRVSSQLQKISPPNFEDTEHAGQFLRIYSDLLSIIMAHFLKKAPHFRLFRNNPLLLSSEELKGIIELIDRPDKYINSINKPAVLKKIRPGLDKLIRFASAA